MGAPVTAVDCDGADTCEDSTDDSNNTDNLTYSLGGTDAASFTIGRRLGTDTGGPGGEVGLRD